MPITIESIRVLEGPNILYPQGGVAAQLTSTNDIREALGQAIKTWAQSVGVIIGYFRMQLEQGEPHPLSVSFTCNHPAIGGAIVRHAVEDLQAAENHDEEYSHDDALFDLRRSRMREDPSLPLLQLRAEAQGRGLPILAVGDGTLQIGSGAASWRFDPAGLSLGMAVAPSWADIHSVPLVAVGGIGATVAAARIAVSLRERDSANVALVVDGTFDAIRAAMLDQTAQIIVTALDLASTLNRGLPFNRCTVGVVLELDGLTEELALAGGLPALVAEQHGAVVLLADDARSADLARRTAANVVQLRAGETSATPTYPLVASVVAAVQGLLNEGGSGGSPKGYPRPRRPLIF